MTVILNGRPVSAEQGAVLSDIAGIKKPCGGHGKCGKCRVTAKGELSSVTETERAFLTDKEIRRGVRLACMTRVLGDCEIITDGDESEVRVVSDGITAVTETDPAFTEYGVAVDVGTTTLAVKLYDAQGNILSSATALNPQSLFGADVISRIEAAISGEDTALASCIRKAIDGLINNLAVKAGVLPERIDGAVITGNTVMLYLLTGTSVEPFSHAPFKVPVLFGETVSASSLSLTSLKPETQVYLPPCISAFVGADITCAILSSGLCGGETAMLADIGTNGELALFHEGRLTVCSTAAGPAFEGVGISMGMQGSDGAIDKVSEENGKLSAHVIGNVSPVGICGSGLVDAAACMLKTGVLEEDGYLEDVFDVFGGVVLTPKDVRMLQLAKSAIYGGIMTLLDSEGIAPEDVRKFYIAGGFGYYLNADNAASIGLIPRALAARSSAVGNAALGGASMLLLNASKRDECRRLAEIASLRELSANPVFERFYVEGMIFGSNDD